MGSRSGGKFSSSHSTLIEAAEPLVTFVNRLPEVSKISLGFIRSIRGNGTNLHRTKYDISEKACLKATVRGGISIQELRFYCPSPAELQKKLEAQFSS
ncbi:hypothetical protein BH11PAT4_BH11PAT4_6370 [soil metagenome]